MRKRSLILSLLLSLALVPITRAQTSQPATKPANPLHIGSRPGGWMKRHDAIVERVKKGNVDLLMIGDSITQNYEKHSPPDEDFKPTWDQFFAPRNAVNLGFSGDQTGNVLWRLTHGEIDGISPKAAVILIGTNDTRSGRRSVDETLAGINAIVDLLHEKLPNTKLLLLAILPSQDDNFPEKPEKDLKINAALKEKYGNASDVTYLDIGHIFMKDGTLDSSLFYDLKLPPDKDGKKRGPLHPNTQGQRMMAEAIEPTLKKLMGEK